MYVQTLNSFLHHDKYLAWEELSSERLRMGTFPTHLAQAVVYSVSIERLKFDFSTEMVIADQADFVPLTRSKVS